MMTSTAVTEIITDDFRSQAAEIETVKAFHRAFPTGVTIVTAKSESGAPAGLVVNAFSSVSMEPPMVLVCVNRSSQSHETFAAGRHIGISVLADNQSNEAMSFAKSGGDKFSAVTWHDAPNGSPLIDGSAAALEMEIVQLVSAGTHTVFFGIVTSVETSNNAPLLYHDGKFFEGNNLKAV